ncbi:oligosaccharide flippase family protein [Metabacillus idriensis]|uniref:oligosaccharide flippase family protein n=1 Tax=Metabacillus idriensis TaxID=324768 RepID=UPI00174BCBA6|nr:oligosaccharide flippase family protein [Metabacillus idriensis]
MKLIFLYLFQLLSVLSGFFYQVILAKNVSVQEFGTLNVILTAIIIFGTIGSFGIGPNLLRLYNKYDLSLSVKPIFTLLTITSLFSVGIFSLFFFNVVSDISSFLLIFSITLLVTRIFTPVTEAFFQINDQIISLSLLRFYQQFSRLVAAVLLIYFSFTGLDFLIIAGALSLISIFISIVSFKKLKQKRNNNYNHSVVTDLKSAFTFTVPYAGASIYYQIYFQVYIILFGILQMDTEAAYYSAVFNFINVASVFLLLYFQTYMLPKIHQNYSYEYIVSFRKTTVILSLLSFIPISIISYFGQNIIQLAYGNDLMASSIYFSIMIFFVPIRILINGFGSLLINEDTVELKSIIQRFAAIISIIMGLLFIYLWGIKGAILSFYIVEVYILIKFTILISRTLKKLRSL